MRSVGQTPGRVITKAPNNAGGVSTSYYGGGNTRHHIGWFGPTDHNGYWNPHYPEW